MAKEQEKEIKIEKMVLNIDGEKVNLSMEQAKKLKKILDELFGKEVEVVKEHHYHDNWYTKPYYWKNTWDTGIDKKFGDIVWCADSKSIEFKV